MIRTAVCSGPAAQRPAVTAALAAAGLSVDPAVGHGHGHPDCTDGTADETVGWVTVEGDDLDVDAVAAAVSPLGWVLRGHWGAPLPLSSLAPGAADWQARLEDLERRLADLGAGK